MIVKKVKTRLKRIILILLALTVLGSAMVFGVNGYVVLSTKSQI